MKLNIKGNLIYLIAFIMIVSFSLLAIYVISQEYKHIEFSFEEKLIIVSNVISDDQTIIDKLVLNDETIQDDLINYNHNVPILANIIIIDNDKEIKGTLSDHLIGQTFEIDGIDRAINGESYRLSFDFDHDEDVFAYVKPIMNGSNQEGVLILYYLEGNVLQVKHEKLTHLLTGFGLGLTLSLLSLWGLTKKYKSELFGLAPSKIAMLYAENRSIIEQINEGIISVDDSLIITRVNQTLLKMFELNENIVGQKVSDVFPHVDFKLIIESNKHIDNKYRKINSEKYLMNSFPLYLDKKIIGATAIFRTHYEVDSLIDQISGYQSIAEALRSQKHEFQNKLHVVLGLIKMKDYEKAENYIMENVYTTNLASDYYTSRIKDDRVLALFVGKEIQSAEFNVSLLLTSDSYMTKTHNPINSDDIVLVLGNLIDNSFEAYRNSDVEDKRVVVDIFEDEDQLKLTVIDQAGGIDPKVFNKMFERGISTKQGDSRGTGLSLVSEIITVYNGEKHVTSKTDETKIEIILMKVIS